jgi:hypothetical protein
VLDTYGHTPTAVSDVTHPLRRRIAVGEVLGEDMSELESELTHLEDREDAK